MRWHPSWVASSADPCLPRGSDVTPLELGVELLDDCDQRPDPPLPIVDVNHVVFLPPWVIDSLCQEGVTPLVALRIVRPLRV